MNALTIISWYNNTLPTINGLLPTRTRYKCSVVLFDNYLDLNHSFDLNCIRNNRWHIIIKMYFVYNIHRFNYIIIINNC